MATVVMSRATADAVIMTTQPPMHWADYPEDACEEAPSRPNFPAKLHGFPTEPHAQVCYLCTSNEPTICVRTPKSFAKLGLKLKWLCARHWNNPDLLCHLNPDEQPVPQTMPPLPPRPQEPQTPQESPQKMQRRRILHLRPSMNAKEMPNGCKMPESLDFIYDKTDLGMAIYLGHGLTRTTYSFKEDLVLKVGNDPAQLNEQSLSEQFPEFFPRVYERGEAKFWDEGGKRALTTIEYLVSERVVPLPDALQEATDVKKLVMHVMSWLVVCAKNGILTRDAKAPNLGLRNGKVVALDCGAYEVWKYAVPKSRLTRTVMSQFFKSLKGCGVDQTFLDELISIWQQSSNLEQVAQELNIRLQLVEYPWPAWEAARQAHFGVAPPAFPNRMERMDKTDMTDGTDCNL
jgi:hypothetical protein